MHESAGIVVQGHPRLAASLVARLSTLLPGVAVRQAPLDGPVAGVLVPIVRLDRVTTLEPWLGGVECSLSIGLHRGLVYIGPFRRAGAPGCLACLVSRVAGSAYGPSVDGDEHVIPASPAGCDPLGLPAIVSTPILVAGELREHLAGRRPRTTTGAIVLDQETGEVVFETLVPDANCVICAPPPTKRLPGWADRDAERECDAHQLRVSDAPSLIQSIQGVYLNRHIGLLKDVQIDLQSPYGTCYLELPLKGKRSEPCIGRSTSYDKAQSVAILEALERYCGWRRGGPREILMAPFADVADQAIDPVSLGLHPEECYALPGYPFARVTPDLPIDWVWGWSFRRQAPVLVPARYAFYGHKGGRPFVYEVSNGCALGATLEEAVIHGIFELVERDSFLLTWYRKLAIPEISTVDIPDRGVRDLLRRAELVTGTKLRLFSSTREHGIPSLFAVATSDVEGTPQTLAAGSAHVDLLQATRSVLYELAGLTLRMQTILLERRADSKAMVHDPRLVRKMEDHSLVNCLPETRERFSFLLDRSDPPLSFAAAQAASRVQLPARTSPRAAMCCLVDRLLSVGLDVVVVDQTMSELGPAGLRCAKVIVPGLLSMTFGHIFRRTEHLPRLHAALPEACVGVDAIGAEPHPFP